MKRSCGALRRALRQRLALMLSAASITLGVAAPAQAQSAAEVNARLDTLFGSHAPYQSFFSALQLAMASDDRQAVAHMVDYPLHTRIDGKAVTVKDTPQFVARYDGIVSAELKRAVAAQSYADLFANWQGVSIGDGKLWFSGVGKNHVVRITAINN